MQYHSDHPKENLELVVRLLFGRVKTRCSNTALKVEEECKIMEELQANGYPKRFIERARKKMLLTKNKGRNYMEVLLEDQQVLCQSKARTVMPYKHGDSKRIRRILDPFGIQVSFKPKVANKNHLSCLKVPIPVQDQTGATCSISCSDCGKLYIGEAGWYIAWRVLKHRMNMIKGNVSGRMLAKHA